MHQRQAQRKIPVTVISGFLGAGKTTLVNHLMQQHTGGRIGVVVNEFGEVGIDGQLIVAEEEALIEINNGCVCCTVRADLVASVKELLARSHAGIERLIVETSGLADPAPVLQTFLADPDLREAVELESVVTVVDGHHFGQQLNDEIVREQVAFADVIVINKIDLIDQLALQQLKLQIRALNPTASITTASHSRVAADSLLGVRRFSLPALLELEPDLLDENAHDHEHDVSIQSCALIETGALDPDRFNRWINQLVQERGQQLMRMKGVLHFASEPRQF
uniref:CobW family GTP-binding protein n=1 Tax=uncultured Caballeronia sp. TaxID=1827198 RepID=UPI001574EEF8